MNYLKLFTKTQLWTSVMGWFDIFEIRRGSKTHITKEISYQILYTWYVLGF